MVTLYRLGLIAAIPLCLTSLQAQQSVLPNHNFGSYAGSEKWIQFNESAQVPATTLWSEHGKDMGLGKHDQMTWTKTETDKFGWTHHRFQQFHKGVPVEFALFKIHEQQGIARKGNGEIIKDIDLGVTPSLSRDEALSFALQHIGASVYNWQVPQLEEMKRHATDDPAATFYPAGELIITDRDFDQRNSPVYGLAWKFEIYAHRPESRRWIYVDAHNGQIIKELNLDIHENGYPGIAETRYSGPREIVADSTPVGYILRDKTRGRGIETYDALHYDDREYTLNFFDDNNLWENANHRADDAATDAHWGTELYYDYMLERHGFQSFNNLGSKLISYVHVGQNWFNARWTGFWAEYGDAAGEPWTHIDVVGHEITHGFTWATAGLIYEGESGALNESFSDIVGEALQRHANGITDWVGTPAPVDTIRSYMNPNDFENPDTYHGQYWEFTEADNFGVHTNSGVQNFMFYLLSEGGTGTNDNGDDYTVEAIGFDKAIDILMRSMIVYLFPTSDYFDARQGSLQSAEDLFGSCSFEYQQVANAWHAVGVGERVSAQDFTVLNVEKIDLCTVGATAPVRMQIKYLGCELSGPVILYLALQKTNPFLTVNDTLEIPEGVVPGAIIEYEFSKEIPFTRTGEHLLTGIVTSAPDLNKANDHSQALAVHKLSQVSEQAFRFHVRIAARTFKDSMAFFVGSFADLDVALHVGKDSTYGIRIEGDRIGNAKPIYDNQDVFDLNERLGTQVCFCVNPVAMDTLSLHFDLRQTYSNGFQETVGIPQPKSSAMRILVGGDELARYFPETNDADDWKTHNIDLSQYLGSEFVLCFETRTIQSQDRDHDDIGDRVFLDNIEFVGREETSATGDINFTAPLIVYPNPTGDILFIEIPTSRAGAAEVVVLDVHGKVIASEQQVFVAGHNVVEFNLEGVVDGVYVVEVRTAGEKRIGKVVKQ